MNGGLLGLRNTTTEWGSLAKALHWLIAIGLFALIYRGLEQAGMERGDEKSRLRFIHASIATGVLLLMTVRIVWRFMNDVPAHPEGNSKIQRIISDAVHWGLTDYLNKLVAVENNRKEEVLLRRLQLGHISLSLTPSFLQHLPA